MSNILSNKYFLGATTIIAVGLAYYGYQSTNNDITNSASTADMTTTPATTTVTVSASESPTPSATEATTTEGTTTTTSTDN